MANLIWAILCIMASTSTGLFAAGEIIASRKFSRLRAHILCRVTICFSLAMSAEVFVATSHQFSAACQLLICLEIGLFCPALACYIDKVWRILATIDPKK